MIRPTYESCTVTEMNNENTNKIYLCRNNTLGGRCRRRCCGSFSSRFGGRFRCGFRRDNLCRRPRRHRCCDPSPQRRGSRRHRCVASEEGR